MFVNIVAALINEVEAASVAFGPMIEKASSLIGPRHRNGSEAFPHSFRFLAYSPTGTGQRFA